MSDILHVRGSKHANSNPLKEEEKAETTSLFDGFPSTCFFFAQCHKRCKSFYCIEKGNEGFQGRNVLWKRWSLEKEQNELWSKSKGTNKDGSYGVEQLCVLLIGCGTKLRCSVEKIFFCKSMF